MLTVMAARSSSSPEPHLEVPAANSSSPASKFSCPDCGEGFVNNARLEEHIRTHPGLRPYRCSRCGKGFLTAGNKYRHERQSSDCAASSTEPRPYSCFKCGKAFSTIGNKDRHEWQKTDCMASGI